MNGPTSYIKLFRSITDWEWYHDEACTRLFIHLLLKVNWKAGKWAGRDIPPGTWMTSLAQIAEQLGWSRSKIRNTLDKLKTTNEVTTVTTNHWTAITVVNWAKYQDSAIDYDQPTTNHTANQQPATRPTNSRPPATIEEGKKAIKEKREEESTWPTFDNWWDAYDKKADRIICEPKWLRLDQKTKEAIMAHTPGYVKAKPDKTFRRDPATYLNRRTWEDGYVPVANAQPAKPMTMAEARAEETAIMQASPVGICRPEELSLEARILIYKK